MEAVTSRPSSSTHDRLAHGPQRLISVFQNEAGLFRQRCNYMARAARFLKPSADGVWKFMQTLKSWPSDANRKGIPAQHER